MILSEKSATFRDHALEAGYLLIVARLIERLVESDRCFALLISFEPFWLRHSNDPLPIMGTADDSIAIVCEPVRVQRNALDSRPVIRDRTHVSRCSIRLNQKGSRFYFNLRMILSEKSATFRDHALAAPRCPKRSLGNVRQWRESMWDLFYKDPLRIIALSMRQERPQGSRKLFVQFLIRMGVNDKAGQFIAPSHHQPGLSMGRHLKCNPIEPFRHCCPLSNAHAPCSSSVRADSINRRSGSETNRP
jgi:hypothetical protein